MIEQVFEGLGRAAGSGQIAEVARALSALGQSGEAPPAELIDQVRCLEELKSAAAAAQARVSAVFAATQRSAQRAAGIPEPRVGAGIAAQVALARRDSPHRGGQHLGLAEALTMELPHTLAALASGQISEWRATLVVRETACLSVEHRRLVDAELAGRPGGMGALGDRAIAAEARRIGYRLDPYAVTDRASRAAADRRVSLRPAPDAMTWLGALLPATQGVAAYAALSRYADTRRADGAELRGRGQVMADTLVERITGQATATAVPVEVHLIMTDRALLGAAGEPADEPAELDGYGPIPAPLIRNMLRGSNTGGDSSSDSASAVPAAAKAWVRRLYIAPDTGALVAMDTRRRCFDGQLRRFLITADRRCRTPWCDAPIRHLDHPLSVTHGGKSTAANSQGLCEACNYTKETPGWATIVRPGRMVETITPTGHSYTSRPPPPVGKLAPPDQAAPSCRDAKTPSRSRPEQRLRDRRRTA